MKNLKFSKIFFIIFTSATILTSCDAEKELISKSNRNIKKGNTEISFNDFKRETKLDDFKTNIKLTPQNYLARTADGAYEMSDFDLDTEIIKRLELDNDVSYTFRILPKIIITPNSFYNLTLHNKDGEWIENIIELKPSQENFDNLLIGNTQELDGKASIIYTSNMSNLISENGCYSVEIIGNNCENIEAISDECAIKKHSTFCFNQENIVLGSEAEIYSNSGVISPDYSFMFNTNNIKEDLIKFAQENKIITDKIKDILAKEGNLSIDSISIEEIQGIHNENELKIYFESKGVTDSATLISLLKNQEEHVNFFIKNNPEICALSESKRNALISDAFIKEFESEVSSSMLERRSCHDQWNRDTSRCTRDYAIAGTLAVIGTVATGGWGLLGVVGAMVAYRNCLSDAREDYIDCRT
jgi:hypothetical protein